MLDKYVMSPDWASIAADNIVIPVIGPQNWRITPDIRTFPACRITPGMKLEEQIGRSIRQPDHTRPGQGPPSEMGGIDSPCHIRDDPGMKTDLYTKVILTVIAVCLAVIVIEDIPIVETANAQTGGPIDVNLVSIDGKSFSRHGGLISGTGIAVPVTIED